MSSDQGTDQGFKHIADYTAHPHYRHECYLTDSCRALGPMVLLGDEVLSKATPDNPLGDPLGTVVAIYLDGMVELSTGDQVAAADLVLLRRAQ